MKDVVAASVLKFFESSTTKSVAISIAMGVLGFLGHSLLQLHSQGDELTEHRQAIVNLTAEREKDHDVIENISIVIERIEGKIDVLNQKIDDRTKHR